jgi:hypothetical protein
MKASLGHDSTVLITSLKRREPGQRREIEVRSDRRDAVGWNEADQACLPLTIELALFLALTQLPYFGPCYCSVLETLLRVF